MTCTQFKYCRTAALVISEKSGRDKDDKGGGGARMLRGSDALFKQSARQIDNSRGTNIDNSILCVK